MTSKRESLVEEPVEEDGDMKALNYNSQKELKHINFVSSQTKMFQYGSTGQNKTFGFGNIKIFCSDEKSSNEMFQHFKIKILSNTVLWGKKITFWLNLGLSFLKY